MVKKSCTFKNLEEILKILKPWKKFRKPGENFQKTFGHPEYISLCYLHELFSLIADQQQLKNQTCRRRLLEMSSCHPGTKKIKIIKEKITSLLIVKLVLIGSRNLIIVQILSGCTQRKLFYVHKPLSNTKLTTQLCLLYQKFLKNPINSSHYPSL